jgi:hypothetical protein
MPRKSDFTDLAALRSAIAAQREQRADDNSLVTGRQLEPLLAAVLRLTEEVEELRRQVKMDRLRGIATNAQGKESANNNIARGLPPR